ncbi:MAG: hemerythrin domain-containing protein [Polyangiaceae bacterium]
MPNRVEVATSAAISAIKDVKATVKGLSGVFKHLMEEHGKVSALIMRVKMSSDVDVRARLYPTIRADLLAHEAAELKVVYPAMAQFPDVSAIAHEHAYDAGEIERQIAEVDSLSFSDTSWGPAFAWLAELVQKHVAKEEGDYFPQAQKAMGENLSKQLLPIFEAAKRKMTMT